MPPYHSLQIVLWSYNHKYTIALIRLNEMMDQSGPDLPAHPGSSPCGAAGLPLVEAAEQLWAASPAGSAFIVWILQHGANWGNGFPWQNLHLDWSDLGKKIIIHWRRWRSLLMLLLAGLAEWFTSTQSISIGALLTDAPVVRGEGYQSHVSDSITWRSATGGLKFISRSVWTYPWKWWRSQRTSDH